MGMWTEVRRTLSGTLLTTILGLIAVGFALLLSVLKGSIVVSIFFMIVTAALGYAAYSQLRQHRQQFRLS